ncbi:hypothetical protein ABZT02_15080 [Streptomyces sp. NPDC005402]|uniref:hypothetical protein n=1 Tax=Streptomyces sp. NPDC005402 TaxID=3155338 RepID=UPI0033B0642D
MTDTASRCPERTAIVLGDDHITYAGLDASVGCVSNLLVLARGAVASRGRGALAAAVRRQTASTWVRMAPASTDDGPPAGVVGFGQDAFAGDALVMGSGPNWIGAARRDLEVIAGTPVPTVSYVR